ncbi:MAG: hypothetical protein RMK57_00930 [Bryobacterales bacterium]|nr:hypothetical protein [Bryobacteraceae bacterium]MDW8353068.1 hypothetical protein [Bryobacterales bacterium]
MTESVESPAKAQEHDVRRIAGNQIRDRRLGDDVDLRFADERRALVAAHVPGIAHRNPLDAARLVGHPDPVLAAASGADDAQPDPVAGAADPGKRPGGDSGG